MMGQCVEAIISPAAIFIRVIWPSGSKEQLRGLLSVLDYGNGKTRIVFGCKMRYWSICFTWGKTQAQIKYFLCTILVSRDKALGVGVHK